MPLQEEGFVYMWTNDINSKWYIGSHKGTIDDGYTGSGKIFLQAVEKYGIENFTRTILYEGTEFREQEKLMLDQLDAANCNVSYNLKNTSIGGNAFGENHHWFGRHHTEETKQKLSDINRGKKHTEESKRKMSEARKGSNAGEKCYWYGKKHTDEAKRKIGEASKGNTYNLGRKHTEEARKNMSEAGKGRVFSEEHKKKIGDAHRGRKHTEEARKNMSEAQLGRKHSEEARKNMSEAQLGRKHSEESKEKISKAHKGKTVSEESRKKMSESKKNSPRIACPHCNKEGNISNMKRWHFDNCKHKE